MEVLEGLRGRYRAFPLWGVSGVWLAGSTSLDTLLEACTSPKAGEWHRVHDCCAGCPASPVTFDGDASPWCHACKVYSFIVSQGWNVSRPSQLRITLLADGDFLKSIQIGFVRTLRHIERLKGFCSNSNSRGFGRKIIHMVTGIIQAMINDSIFWWSRSGAFG